MPDLSKDLDATPLVQELLAKTKAGKVPWQPTAASNSFVVSIAGQSTFKVMLDEFEDADEYGRPVTVSTPALSLVDGKGKLLWRIQNTQVKGGGLWELYQLAQRVGNKLDEQIENAISALQKL
jgi:hypothetical protein